jgi:hypothetical protein
MFESIVKLTVFMYRIYKNLHLILWFLKYEKYVYKFVMLSETYHNFYKDQPFE